MTNKEKNLIITMASFFMVACSSLLVIARDLIESDALNSRNVADSIILLTELATESSEDCVRAKADHIEMLGKYVKHMENRHRPWAFVSKNDITIELKLAIKKLEENEGEGETDQQMESCVKIKTASKAIAEFLSKHKLFANEPIVGSELEVVSKEMQTVIKGLLDEAHKKTQTYINDLNMVNSEVAYRANRKVIVYLYLVRSQWSKIVTSEERINLMGDINRTIYWNRVLMKHSDITEEERSRLTKCSINELRHLRLLHAIIDNDMNEVHAWLQIAIKEAFPDVQFLAER